MALANGNDVSLRQNWHWLCPYAWTEPVEIVAKAVGATLIKGFSSSFFLGALFTNNVDATPISLVSRNEIR